MAFPAPEPKTDSRGKGGYECEFVKSPPDYLQTECPVCLLVLRSSHITSCCAHTFCKECIERVRNDGMCCPLCNAEEFFLTYNRAHDASLKQLEVYCTNRKIGCEWQGKVESLNKHLNVDPEIDKQLEGCAVVEVQCCHDGCELSFERRLISKHQSEECPQRPFTCEYCSSYKATYHDVMTNHWPVCKSYPLPCPNKCTDNAIQRQSLEIHVKEECPLQEIDCEFKYAGCETKLPRKDMPEHLKGNLVHISLLARQNHELMAKLLEKDETIKRMEEKFERLASKQDEMEGLLKALGEKQDSTRTELEQVIEKKQDSTRKELEGRIEGLEEEQDESSSYLEKMCHHVQIAPVQIVMPDFQRHKRNKERWYSDSFYTHPQGYKMSLMVDANGQGDGRGTHLSYFVHLMRGEFDNHLQWPFRGNITLKLLNQQEDNHHHTRTLSFNDQTPAESTARITIGERSTKGRGHKQFIAHSELGHFPATNRQYLMNDCLFFRLKVELT